MTVGGFMALETVDAPVSFSVMDLWSVRANGSWLFANARSALAHLLREGATSRLWLPALICPELATVAGNECSLAYYPLAPDLSPDIPFLETALQAGDCIVAVDYFGRAPSRRFRDFAAGRDDVVWVDDRAQALAPGCDPWAEWVLYSPRKLFGVPDGGILVRMQGQVATPAFSGADVTAATAARGGEIDAEGRFALYRETECRNRVSMRRMSRLSRSLLARIDPRVPIRRRRENFAALAGLLEDVALLRDGDNAFAALGFPVTVPDCEQVWRRLCEAGVFAARHFATLPSDPAVFPFEHELGRSTVTLPCDQRYDGDDMRRVAAAFRAACR